MNLNENWGYLQDCTGENISNLNKYYAELTGQYWAWKNIDADIIGFCHYRRYFMKDFLLKNLLTKNEIKEDLENFDIILPQLKHLNISVSKAFFNFNKTLMGAKPEEYDKLRKILKEYYPDYLASFDKIMNGNTYYVCNMFIARKNIANNYFKWLFAILNKLEKEIDFSKYSNGNLRVLGYISEVLLTIYVDKNKLKVKEKYFLNSEAKAPHLILLCRRFPFIDISVNKLADIIDYKN